jgi:hypothetical protein
MSEYSKRSRPRAGTGEARLIVASSDQDANMLWATRMFVPDPFIFIKKGRVGTIVIGDLEIDRARGQAAVDQVLPWSRYAAAARNEGVRFPSHTDILVRVAGEMGVGAFRVPESFPLALADGLREQGLAVRVQPDPFWPEREIKTAEEIGFIRDSLRIAEEGLAAGVAALRRTTIGRDGMLRLDGTILTSETLKATINSKIMDHHRPVQWKQLLCRDDHALCRSVLSKSVAAPLGIHKRPGTAQHPKRRRHAGTDGHRSVYIAGHRVSLHGLPRRRILSRRNPVHPAAARPASASRADYACVL